jgi:hypothetical protein
VRGDLSGRIQAPEPESSPEVFHYLKQNVARGHQTDDNEMHDRTVRRLSEAKVKMLEEEAERMVRSGKWTLLRQPVHHYLP